jgi:hypothetical protein
MDEKEIPRKPLLSALLKRWFAGSLPFFRWATVSFGLPILLAWLLANALHHHLHPSDAGPVAPNGDRFGPISIKIGLPGTIGALPQPLLVCGRTGDAELVYIRILANRKARVGVEFWGLRADESAPFDLPSMDAVLDIKCYLPAFFPQEGDDYWRPLPASIQRSRRTQYFILVDKVVRLKGALKYDLRPHSPIYFGENPLGGSLVADRFAGTVLQTSQAQY